MGVIQRIKKPTTRKGKKVLIAREPKLIEGPKNTLFLRGRNSSEILNNVMKDLYHFKKPDAKFLSKKNDILPFENVIPVEILSKKNDCSLFVFGSHNKKRPHNLIIGRMFDHTILDMFELGVSDFKSLHEFETEKITTGIKPCLVFSGEWEKSPETTRLKSLLVDLFHREKTESVRLQGLEHVLSFTLFDGKVLFHSYRILLKKSGCKIPRIELKEIGPSMSLNIRRTQLASDDLMKQACRQPKELKTIVKKNITKDKLGTVHGRIHLGKQNINKIQTRKMKGLRKTVSEKKQERKSKKRVNTTNDNHLTKKMKVK